MHKKLVFWGVICSAIIIVIGNGIIIFFPRLPPPIIFNVLSESLTKGVYFFHRDATPPYSHGDIVLLETNERIKEHLKKFFPSSPDRLLKIIVALEGDTICRKENEVVISSRNEDVLQYNLETAFLRSDLSAGCFVLPANQIFVGGQSPRSFDSRYFGYIPSSSIIGIYKFHR